MLFESQAHKTCIVQEMRIDCITLWFPNEHEERVGKLMVSTRLKNINQIGYFPHMGMKIKAKLKLPSWGLLKVA